MIRRLFILLLIVGWVFTQGDPPFSGTIFIDSDIITSLDSTTFEDATYIGQGIRTMFDRRINDWVNYNAYLFNATYDDDFKCEIQVNPEFSSEDSAMIEAIKYGNEIGRLPKVLRRDVETVWIHKGTQPFGGGNKNILIHTGQAIDYIKDGILEEVFVHEAAHTSLDSYFQNSTEWIEAQNNDNNFISMYAQDYPYREDIAESFLPWFAVRYRSERINLGIHDNIIQSIPNRLDFFDNQMSDLLIIGCRDESACNFNPKATDPGHCRYTDGICSSCHDGEIVDNDRDDDGVCNYADVCDGYDDNLDNDFNGIPDGCDLSIYKGVLPDQFSISSIYPNPFNPIIRITYELPKNGDVHISIYDIRGVMITSLLKTFKTGGYHEINWNASSYPSGVYLIRMDSGDFTQIQKIVLVK